MWEQKLIKTARGEFEIFEAGNGEPLCVTHLYSEFNKRGYYFADMFVAYFKVYLVNLKGGMLGLVYAYRHPNFLKRLIVGGASATNDYMEHKDSIYSYKNPVNKRLQEILSILNSNESTREERVQAGKEWTEMSLYDPKRFDKYFSKPSSGKVVQKRLDYYSFNELPNYDIRENISKIKTPTIVFCGRYDSQCPFVYSEEIHHLVTNSKFYIFEKSNHTPYLEEKEKFNEMVMDFVDLI